MTVDDSDDAQLVAQLDRTIDTVWSQIRILVSSGALTSRTVRWSESKQTVDGTFVMRYPLYDEQTKQAVELLSAVGAVTPLYRWMDHHTPQPSASGAFGTADAIRAATAVVRGERFCDGTIASAVQDGTLHAILTALITWHDGEPDAA
jgi:hypothetical protein